MEGESSFAITVDTSSYSNDGEYTVTLIVQLVNYPTTVAIAYSEFIVDVLPILDPWVPPPQSLPVEVKEEQSLPLIIEELKSEPEQEQD